MQSFIALPPTYAYLNYTLVLSVFESYINGIIQYVLEGHRVELSATSTGNDKLFLKLRTLMDTPPNSV